MNLMRGRRNLRYAIPLVLGITLAAYIALQPNPEADLRAALNKLETYPASDQTIVGNWGHCLRIDRKDEGTWTPVAWGEGESAGWYAADPSEATVDIEGIELFCPLGLRLNVEIRLPLLPAGEYRVCETDETACVPVQIPPISDR
jgi:hypothetical protein